MAPEIIPDFRTVDYSRKWHAMAAVGTGVFLATVDGSIINVSLPTLVLSWHWIFFVNLPVGIIGTLMVKRNLPDFKPGSLQQFDVWGALALCSSILFLLLGLTLGQTVGVAVIGAIWAGRTLFYAGAGTSRGATLAPVDAQIAGLHDAFLTAAVFTLIALLLSIRAHLQETRRPAP